MTAAPFPILYEDNHLLAVVKPPGIATMGVPGDRSSVLALAKQYIKQRWNKPGNVYLGVVSRLDVPVSGALLMARTSKAAARLNEQFRGREVEKVYWAILEGRIDPPAGSLCDWLVKHDRHRRMEIATPNAAGAQEARLSYRTIERLKTGTLVEILLETGRKHQIRVQFAASGHPVLGDRKYGGRGAFAAGIALHARRLGFIHPVRRKPMELVAPLPPSWGQLGIRDEGLGTRD